MKPVLNEARAEGQNPTAASAASGCEVRVWTSEHFPNTGCAPCPGMCMDYQGINTSNVSQQETRSAHPSRFRAEAMNVCRRCKLPLTS